MELGQVVDILINDNPKGIGLVMRRHVACAKSLGHGGRPLYPTDRKYLPITRDKKMGKQWRSNASVHTKIDSRSRLCQEQNSSAFLLDKKGPFGLAAAEGRDCHMLRTARGHFRGPQLPIQKRPVKFHPLARKKKPQKSGVIRLWGQLSAGTILVSSHAPTRISSVFPRLHRWDSCSLFGFTQKSHATIQVFSPEGFERPLACDYYRPRSSRRSTYADVIMFRPITIAMIKRPSRMRKMPRSLSQSFPEAD